LGVAFHGPLKAGVVVNPRSAVLTADGIASAIGHYDEKRK
jgi:hypothetical protein